MAKRGRPAGATSFVRIDMRTLNNLFKQQQHIPVSRIWLREQGYELEDSEPVRIAPNSTIPTEPQEKVDMVFTA